MRSLNECLGDGRSIPIEYAKDGLLSDINETCLHEPSKDEIIRVERERELRVLPNNVPMKSASAMN